ncbi:MAG: HesA/MoeB/ThiF family protein [Blautia wexlerae]
MTYVPGEGPCCRCVFKIRRPRMRFLPVSRQVSSEQWEVSSVLLQAMEAIKYLIGVGDLLTGYLLTFDALTMEFHKVKLPKDTHDCAVCGDHPTILEPGSTGVC